MTTFFTYGVGGAVNRARPHPQSRWQLEIDLARQRNHEGVLENLTETGFPAAYRDRASRRYSGGIPPPTSRDRFRHRSVELRDSPAAGSA